MATTSNQSYVSITANLDSTCLQLQQHYPGMQNIKVVNTGLTFEQAMRNAEQYARQNCCLLLPCNEIKYGSVYCLFCFEC